MKLLIGEQIIKTCELLHRMGYVLGGTGNVSFCEGGHIYITPTKRNKATLNTRDIAALTMDGSIIWGDPSSEYHVHVSIYNLNPSAKAVIHAHPPITTALSRGGKFPEMGPSDIAHFLEQPVFIGYFEPGSVVLAQAVGEASLKSNIIIMKNHGIITWGTDLEEALLSVEAVEHYLQVHLYERLIKLGKW